MKKLSLTLLLTFSIFLSYSVSDILAQEDSTGESQTNTNNPILYVLEECPYCQELRTILEANDIYTMIEIDLVDVSIEENAEAFRAHAQECALGIVGVPTMYYEGRCYQSTYIIRDEIFSMAGVTVSEESDEDDDRTNLTSITDADNSEETTSESISEAEGRSLAQSLNGEQEERKLGFFSLLIALVAPSLFIALMFYIIKKMGL